MTTTYRKLRKLFRDPALFLADSRLVRQRVGVAVRRKRAPETTQQNVAYLGNPVFPRGIDFVVYFSSKAAFAYQIEQWLPALRALAKHHTVVILTRNGGVHRHFVTTTEFPVMYCKSLQDLMAFYERVDVRCVLYVNNAAKNFQSLIHQRALHVHLNHGESEKSSMHSNQAKAYDYVFVVGDAGRQRYEQNVLKADSINFVKVGRPQLDGIAPIEPRGTPQQRVVLYAPTWAAHHDSMNYSSIAAHGEEITRAFVDNEGSHFIYRPHPSVGTTDKREAEAHARILEVVDASPQAELLMEGDINRIFPAVDIGIFDNSSVLIDYLRVDKPFLFTNIVPAGATLPRIASAGRVLDAPDYAELGAICEHEVTADPKRDQRRAEKRHYLGDYGEGEATEAFVAALEQVLSERASLVGDVDHDS